MRLKIRTFLVPCEVLKPPALLLSWIWNLILMIQTEVKAWQGSASESKLISFFSERCPIYRKEGEIEVRNRGPGQDGRNREKKDVLRAELDLSSPI